MADHIYYASVACTTHVSRSIGLNTLVPGGTRGIRSKPNVPYSFEYAKRFGLRLESCGRLMVMSVCGRSLSRVYMLKLGLHHSVEMTWF